MEEKLETKGQTNKNQELLKPTNDVVFQALFTRGKESITKAMLEDILKIKINKIDLDKSKDLLNDNKDNKNGRLDLRAIINDNVECDIEMQLSTHEKMMERFLYYWSKIYASNLQIGEKYSELRKTISIIIINDNIEQFKEIIKAHTKWQIREEKYRDKVLTPYLEIDIIEMPKAIKEYENNKEDELLQWMMFLENPENMEVTKIMEENEDIKDAKEELDKISRDETLRRMALKAEIERMDNEQRMYEARRDGKIEGKLEDAKNMLKKGIDIDTVMEITELTKEEIEKIK